MSSETTPLLWNRNIATTEGIGDDVHIQFCSLAGCPPSNAPAGYKHHVSSKSIYGRATRGLRSQQNTYIFTATLTNTLLLSQVVLGAALTALGAAKQPYIMVTLFGALNTIIAGLVAYLKSRGQPMRSRMYRDDLERVVNEIENSEVMWLGISKDVNGYSDIDTENDVTVRSEVARLTRLYDRAVRVNNMNNPDLYSSGNVDATGGGNKPAAGPAPNPAPAPDQSASAPAPAPAPSNGNTITPAAPTTTPAPAPPPAPPADPDQSPASAPPKKEPPKPEAPKPELLKEEAKKTDDEDDDKAILSGDEDNSKSDSNKDKTTTSTSKTEPASSSSPSPSSPTSKPSTTPAPAPAPAQQSSPAPTPAPAPAQAQAPTTIARPGVAPEDESPATRPRFAARQSSQPKKVKGDDE